MGPTASGKSALALNVAEELDGEIVSADSAQVYRRLDIGTAKPTESDLRRVPHHLLSFVDPGERFHVSGFQKKADETIRQIFARRRLPILVGGTGLYIRAVVERYVFDSQPPDYELRRQLYRRAEIEGSHVLHKELSEVDNVAAERIHPNDVRRIVRALEVYQITGIPFSQSQLKRAGDSPYDSFVVQLTLPRDLLYRRINKRTLQQIGSGWIDEVRGLLEDYDENAPALQILGYRELTGYIKGLHSLDATISIIQKNTRNYARRQLTWLRKERIDCSLDVTGGVRSDLVYKLIKSIRTRWQETSLFP